MARESLHAESQELVVRSLSLYGNNECSGHTGGALTTSANLLSLNTYSDSGTWRTFSLVVQQLHVVIIISSMAQVKKLKLREVATCSESCRAKYGSKYLNYKPNVFFHFLL